MLNGNRTKSERGRSPRDFYETPFELASEAMIKFLVDEELTKRERLIALDAGCGTGVWGNATKWFGYFSNGVGYYPNIYGVDIDIKLEKLKDVYADWWEQDFLKCEKKGFNLIFGNPPYSLAEEFVRHSFELLDDGGYVYFLLRLSFLEGIARGKGLFQEYPMKRVYVCSRRPSFFSTNGKHTTDTLAYAMFLWQKGYRGKTEVNFIDWNYKNKSKY